MQEYQIALSPDLDLAPVDFAAAWNEDIETHSLARAHVIASTSTDYDPTLLAGALITITTGLASNALYDLIKQMLAKKGHQHIHIEETKKPDGTRILIIGIDED